MKFSSSNFNFYWWSLNFVQKCILVFLVHIFIEQPDLGKSIYLVEKYPFLYDKQNKYFKNARMREKAWDEVGRPPCRGGIESQIRVVFFTIHNNQRIVIILS
jgi:hypothetical protein